MEKLKEILAKIDSYPKDAINYSSEYYDLLIELMDEYWHIRKNYKYGEKIIAILFYHDFMNEAVNNRMNCYYIEGRFDKYKNNKDIFPDWNLFIKKCKEDVKTSQKILNDGLINIKAFLELKYLPAFNGFYRKQYLRFILNNEKEDYEVDMDFYKITDANSKELYKYIKDNPLDFIDKLRTK